MRPGESFGGGFSGAAGPDQGFVVTGLQRLDAEDHAGEQIRRRGAQAWFQSWLGLNLVSQASRVMVVPVSSTM